MAVESGIVTKAATSQTYGKYIIYETKDGYSIKYAHLSEILAREGEKIEKGQVIAKSGSTGLVTGAHLHYGIMYEGEYIDPFDFVDLPYTDEVVREYEDRVNMKY